MIRWSWRVISNLAKHRHEWRCLNTCNPALLRGDTDKKADFGFGAKRSCFGGEFTDPTRSKRFKALLGGAIGECRGIAK